MHQNKETNAPKWIFSTLSVTLITLIIVVAFAHSMQQSYNHDENQYITAGKLLTEKNLLPYIDYRYYHLPNIIFINALVFKITDYLLLGARSINTLAFALLIIAIFFTIFKYFKLSNYFLKILIFLAAVNLLIGNPIVQSSTGKAWTHDIPIMLLIMAFLVHLKGIGSIQPFKWFFINGLLIGLATGTRLSYLFTIFPFVLGFLFFAEQTISIKLRFIATFFIGFIIAMLPTIILFIAAPKNFLFDIFTFHTEIDNLYLIERGHYLSLRDMITTFIYYSNDPENIVLLIGLLFLTGIKVFNNSKQNRSIYPISLILMILLCLIASMFLKHVFFPQYLFSLVPIVIIGSLIGISILKNNYKKIAIILFLIFSFSFSNKSIYWDLENLLKPQKWETYWIHSCGEKITKITGDNYVLTLSPLFVLEGGGEIYKEFANSPFIWRTSHLIPRESRYEFNIISPEELNSFLSRNRAYGILTGFEGEFDEVFMQYAMDNNYKEEKIPIGRLFINQQK